MTGVSGSSRLIAAAACGLCAAGAGSRSPSAWCENETKREYGKNQYAGYAKDPEYRETMWRAFTNSDYRYSGSPPDSRPDVQGDVSISCEELLMAAQRGLKLKRALKLIKMTGQHDMLASCKDRNGRSAVMLAAMQGNVDNVDMCLQAHPSPQHGVQEGDAHGVTPLEVASWKGHYMVVDYLLQEGAKSNQHDMFGISALHKAVGHGQRRVALRLLQDGSCDVNVRCKTPTVPPEYEAATTHQTPLHIACRKHAHGFQIPGDRGMVALLLSWGADPSIQDAFGNTPLHYAAQGGDIDVVRLLLKHGADPSMRNSKSEVPLDLLPEWVFYEPWGASLEAMLSFHAGSSTSDSCSRL